MSPEMDRLRQVADEALDDFLSCAPDPHVRASILGAMHWAVTERINRLEGDEQATARVTTMAVAVEAWLPPAPE
jgi:hypothetical protein